MLVHTFKQVFCGECIFSLSGECNTRRKYEVQNCSTDFFIRRS